MQSKAFLIASLSARILAKAAARAQQPVMAIDAFADRDTSSFTLKCQRVPLRTQGKFDPQYMLEAADVIGYRTECLGLVYGSGFEAQPDLLRKLCNGRPLMGNRPEVLETVSNPLYFSNLLAATGIPFPTTQMSRPADTSGWLSKQAGACGGSHVSFIPSSSEDDNGRYFQRHIPGIEWSFLFLANGQDTCPIGFNQALINPQQASGDWSYTGSIRLNNGPEGIASQVEQAAQMLTQKLGLVGLNGLDFIVNGSEWTLIELNPRPPATLELWDVSPTPPLFNLHIDACNGLLPSAKLTQPSGCMAIAVVYANIDSHVHTDFIWPSWCSDLPWGGNVIKAGDPLCTVRAEGLDTLTVSQRALGRRQDIVDQLARFNSTLINGTAHAFEHSSLTLNPR